MKVFQIESLGRGGMAHYTFYLASALQSGGASVTLITTNDYELNQDADFEVRELFRSRGRLDSRRLPRIASRLLKAAAIVKGTRALAKEIRRERPDIVHFQGSLPLADWLFSRFVFRTASRRGARVVYTAHNVLPHEAKPIHRIIYRFIYRRADAIIVHAEENAGRLRALEPRHAALFVVAQGDHTFFSRETDCSREEARRSLNISPRDKIVLFFGAIRPYKGLDTLIEACGLIRERVPDLKVLIVGNLLEDFGKYEQQINTCGLKERVLKMLQYVPNSQVHLYFRAADVVSLPYKETYQSAVIQVAFAFGVPAVCSDVGGLGELIKEGDCGLLHEPDDANGLADRLVQVLSDDSLAENLGRRGKAFAQQHFSWEEIAGRTLNIYTQTAVELAKVPADKSYL